LPSVNEELLSKLQDIEPRFWSKVEKTSACWNWLAGKIPEGYGVFHVERRPYGSHRLAYALTNGPIPDGMLVDHICHNRACVKPEHLRLATPKQNIENINGLFSTNTSGYRGVVFHKKPFRNKPWEGRVKHNGRTYSVGTFATAEEANEAIVARRLELFTHNNADRHGVSHGTIVAIPNGAE
jgi:hypothetical protein